jgi:hypothetical protein
MPRKHRKAHQILTSHKSRKRAIKQAAVAVRPKLRLSVNRKAIAAFPNTLASLLDAAPLTLGKQQLAALRASIQRRVVAAKPKWQPVAARRVTGKGQNSPLVL